VSGLPAPLPPFELQRPDLSSWRLGNTGTAGVWRFKAERPGPRVAITALIHGNELCGAWAAAGLLACLTRHGGALRRGELTIAFCNLDAFDRFDATEPDASRFVEEDLNRVWSPERLADACTRERRRAAELVPWLAEAEVLLDLHSMHEPGPPLLLTGPLASHLSLVRDLGLGGHVVVDAGHQEGVRLRDFGPFGDPVRRTRALLVECGWHGALSSRRVAEDATWRLMLHTGLLPAEQLPFDWKLPTPPAAWKLEVTGAVVARSTNFRFSRDFDNLACIPMAGTEIAADDGISFTTPYDDCVLVMPSLRQLRPGVTVVRLARRAPIAV
jgi:predicted deacylase